MSAFSWGDFFVLPSGFQTLMPLPPYPPQSVFGGAPANATGLPWPERTVVAIKGHLHFTMNDSPSSIATDSGTLEVRIAKHTIDPITLVASTVGPNYFLTGPASADESYLYHETLVWHNAINWFSADQTHWPTYQRLDVNVKTKRKLEPLENLVLVMQNNLDHDVFVLRRLRSLVQTAS